MRKRQESHGRLRPLAGRGPSAGRLDPVDLLNAEDEEALCHVDRFDLAAKVVLERGFSAGAFATIREELIYIHTVLRQHCAKELGVLYPMLQLHGEGPRTLDDWNWRDIWREADGVRERVEDLEDGHVHANLVREMAEGCVRLAGMIRDQILRERQDVLPVIREVLTPKEYKQLQKKFQEFGSPTPRA